MDMRAVSKESDGRIGTGTRFHCIHEQAAFRYRITDWRPFDYFSTWFQDPFNPHLGHGETYDLIPTDNGVELFYRMGPLVDDEANHHPEEEARLIEVYQGFWPDALSGLDEMISQNA